MNNNQQLNNIFQNANFQHWMQTITHAVNNLAQPPANNPRILNIVRVENYCGTDGEDPYEWI